MIEEKPKRILVFCGGGIISGAEIVTLTMMKELALRGYSIFFIVSGWGDGTFRQKLEENNIPFAIAKLGFLYLSKPVWTIDTIIHYPKAFFSIRKIIKNFNPDLTWHIAAQTLVMTYPLLRNRKNILAVHDPQFGSVARMIFKRLNRIVYRYLAVSDALKENLIAAGIEASRIKVIRNGLEMAAIDSSFPLPPNNVLRFGIVGQILPRKGHSDFVSACKILKDRGFKFKSYIIGSGDPGFTVFLRGKIKELGLEEVFVWTNFVESRDEIYKLFDIAVVPSKTFDPLPTSAIEAGLYYKPSIVSNVGGLPEIIRHRETGWIIEAGNSEQLADQMKLCIENPAEAEKIGKNAHQFVLDNFNINMQINSLITLINE